MLMEATAVASQTGLLEHARKSTPSPFLLKTYTLVNDSETDGFISWNEDGTGFVVWKPAEFAQDILPTFFKHSNFSSFIRQLNTYGFRKVATDRWEFCNDNFLRNQKELLFHIRRRKAWTSSQQPTANQANAIPKKVDDDQRSSSTSSDSDYGILMEENKRLKMENGVLSSELMSTKRKCQQLLELVAKDGLLEKLDQQESERPPMLFGVRLDIQGNSKREKMLAEIRENVSNLLSQSCK